MKIAVIKEFIKSPRTVGTIMPSSKHLALEMTKHSGLERAEVVIEIGPGSGAFTSCVISKLQKNAKFIMVELNKDFYKRLKSKYPHVKIVNESAENLLQILKNEGLDKADTIISGLPWAAFPESLQKSILYQIHSALRDGGHFSTYAYFQGCFLPSGKRFRKKLIELFSTAERSRLVIKNFPPAYVYRCIK